MRHRDDLAVDEMLFRYLDGACTPEERTRIERDPALFRQAANLRAFNTALGEVLAVKPSSEEIVAFSLGELTGPRHKEIARLAAADPDLQERIALVQHGEQAWPFEPPVGQRSFESARSGEPQPVPAKPLPKRHQTRYGAISRQWAGFGSWLPRAGLIPVIALAMVLIARLLVVQPIASESRETPLPPTGYRSGQIQEPPSVPNADEIRQLYGGQEITFYGDAVGQGGDLDSVLAAQFENKTGVRVRVIPRPPSATDTYANLSREFANESSSLDVIMVDVIWDGAFTPHLIDLSAKLGERVKDKVTVPWFHDYGVLYYRTDLLSKYNEGDDTPPETWTELVSLARKIQDGERRAVGGSNPNFSGFVWTGAAYEGLTCFGLEWLASQNGGTIIENGRVTINNSEAIEALTRLQQTIGDISPQEVISAQEDDALRLFRQGDAAFMRNWPYAYTILQQDSAVAQNFNVAPLPRGEVAGSRSVSTVGGGLLGVSRYSQHPDAAIEFVRYLTSPAAQVWRAQVGSYIPALEALHGASEVRAAIPFLSQLQDVEKVQGIKKVYRPSAAAGANYDAISAIFFKGVNRVLLGKPAAEIVPQMEQEMQRLLPTSSP